MRSIIRSRAIVKAVGDLDGDLLVRNIIRMNVLETAAAMDLPGRRIAISGDWHGNRPWIRILARAIRALAPDITTVIQAGDWWADHPDVDEAFQEAGIGRVLTVLGNHEPWGAISPLLAQYPGEAIRISNLQWLLPRPYRLIAGGRSILCLGGATSIDRRYRTEGVDWWPEEAITEEMVEAAASGGPADIMITHESPAGTPVRAVQEILRTNPLGIPEEERVASAASRVRVRQVWNSVMPRLLAHGHMHQPGGGTMPDGRRVTSLGCDFQQGNLVFLDLDSLELETPSLREIRAKGAE